MTTNRDQQRRRDFALRRISRPKTVLCRWCGGKIVVNPRGRLAEYCSESHRQLAYQQRKWQRPHAIAALADDIDSAKVRGAIREEALTILRNAGLIPQAMPPSEPPPPHRPPLRIVARGKDSD